MRGIAAAVLLTLALTSCSLLPRGGATALWYDAGAADGDDVFAFTSGWGDWIGGGAAREFADFAISGDSSRRTSGPPSPSSTPLTSVDISSGAPGDNWHLVLMAPVGRRLAPGDYANASRTPTRTAPGIQMQGPGRGCDGESGVFTIYEAAIDKNGRLTKFNASFGHSCGPTGTVPILVGYVRFHASLPTPVPKLASTAKPLPSPTGPATSAHPTEFAVRSPPDAPLDGGANVDETPPQTVIRVIGDRGHIQISAGDWSLTLSAPIRQQLVTGTYPVASRAVAAGIPGSGAGVDISASGDGCNTESGSVTIYEIATAPSGGINRLNAGFQVSSCNEWNGPPVLGFVRYNATMPTPLPWS